MRAFCFRALRVVVALAVVAASVARGQDVSQAQVTGHFGGVTQDSFGTGSVDVDFGCSNTPTCAGSYKGKIRDTGCINFITIADGFSLTGMDLSKPGSFTGVLTVKKALYSDIVVSGPGGNTCTIRPGTQQDLVTAYTGTWDGTSGTLDFLVPADAGATSHFTGTFKADVTVPPPVFPMTVVANIDDRQATATAQFTLRPQDAATPQNGYVFAMAPISIVKDAVIDKKAPMQWFFRKSEKDLPVQCVLAQLSASGQLVGVSASTLQSFVNGITGSQAVAVTILNGVPTVNVGGATFFLGYGTSAESMLNGGINRAAVTVPGAQVCSPTAPQTGWWWNPAEDGRGFSVEKHGPNIFFASFLYDVSGRSTWYVSSGLASLEGSLYVGDLLSASNGQTLGGAYPGFPHLDAIGKVTITFNSATNGTLIWPGGTVPIQRQAFVPDGLSLPAMSNGPESGWWWNESEAGRGFFMEFQGNWLDVAGYMYDDQGNSVWYLTAGQMSGTNRQSFAGNWWSFGNGQTLTGAWRHNTQTSDHVAPVTITFSGSDTASMTLPNGRTTALKRHRF